MKTAFKISLIIALIVCVVGAGIAVLGVAINGWRFETEKWTQRNRQIGGDIDLIDIDLDSEAVKIGTVSGDKIEIKYYESESTFIDIEEKNGELHIDERRKSWLAGIGFHDVDKRVVVIGVPKSFKGELKIKSDAGNVELSELRTGLPLTADLSAGVIKLSRCDFSETKIDSSAGKVTVDECTASDFYCDASAGKIEITSTDLSGDMSIDSSAGEIRISDTSVAGEAKIDAAAETSDLPGLRREKRLQLKRRQATFLPSSTTTAYMLKNVKPIWEIYLFPASAATK